MVDWDKTEAEMEKRLTVLERIAELELREIEYEQIIADVKAREKALREAASEYLRTVQKMVNGGPALPVVQSTKNLEEALGWTNKEKSCSRSSRRYSARLVNIR